MEPVKVLFVGVLIVIWWIGLWGFIDTLLHQFIKASKTTALIVYSSMISLVLFIVWLHPHLLGHII